MGIVIATLKLDAGAASDDDSSSYVEDSYTATGSVVATVEVGGAPIGDDDLAGAIESVVVRGVHGASSNGTIVEVRAVLATATDEAHRVLPTPPNLNALAFDSPAFTTAPDGSPWTANHVRELTRVAVEVDSAVDAGEHVTTRAYELKLLVVGKTAIRGVLRTVLRVQGTLQGSYKSTGVLSAANKAQGTLLLEG